VTGAPAVASGLEVFLSDRVPAYRGARLGLIAHAASVDRSLGSAARRIAAAPGLTLAALFGPEHGMEADAQDMIAVGGEKDAARGLPVHSLYGDSEASLRPSPEMLDGIDVLVADLQDVGSRYYTFAATIAMALEAFAPRGGRLVVLDRPNPIGGTRTEGPGLAPAMRSFVGHIEVPVRHGLTMGELLLAHARRTGLEGALEVVPMRGWRRAMTFAETGLPWVPPSPNMPTVDTALVYPGACLVEATNLSEGRGTTRPFEWIGAPFLDGDALAAALAAERLPGAAFRPIAFVPQFQKWAGRRCGGVALHVLDPGSFLPVRTGVAILRAARRLAPKEFAWRAEPYEFVSDRAAIDLLTGSAAVREGIDADAPLGDLTAGWDLEERAWQDARRDLLLYS
jgi:uncharacterized protein YbbC (DUF1343 family)